MMTTTTTTTYFPLLNVLHVQVYVYVENGSVRILSLTRQLTPLTNERRYSVLQSTAEGEGSNGTYPDALAYVSRPPAPPHHPSAEFKQKHLIVTNNTNLVNFLTLLSSRVYSYLSLFKSAYRIIREYKRDITFLPRLLCFPNLLS